MSITLKKLVLTKGFCNFRVTTDLHKFWTECVIKSFKFPFIYSQCRKAIRMTCPGSVVIPRCLLAFLFPLTTK
jgi:hypothetical protein